MFSIVLVVGDSFKLLTQRIVVLTRSSFNNCYKLPYIHCVSKCALQQLCVSAGTKDHSKGGNYTMFKAVLKKGREGGGRAGKREAGTVCFFMVRRKESINKALLTPIELFFAFGYCVHA